MTTTLLTGDNRLILPTLPERSVQCVVTSPPYYGLRDYGTGVWEGGDADCDHIQSRALKRDTNGGLPPAGQGTRGTQASTASSVLLYRDECRKCGARRIDSQIGLEATPEEYVGQLVAVFREVRRVLADDGVVWLNLGDSYAGSGRGAWDRSDVQKEVYVPGVTGQKAPVYRGLPPKNLLGIPWRVAFALQADGWYLRQEIIWSKPNPMPESVRDRCTKAHEQIFLLAKSGTTTIWQARDTGEWSRTPDLSERLPTPASDDPTASIARWRGYDYYYNAEAIAEPGAQPERVRNDVFGGVTGHLVRHSRGSVSTGHATRNRRSVWTVATEPFPEAHFAVMPTALVEPCILAGSRPGDLVLDPFAGAGTVGVVALTHGRRFLGIELNPEYVAIARRRLERTQPSLLFAAMEAAS